MITFPRTLPFESFVRATFDLQRQEAMNRTRSGHIQAVELADPIWVAHYETVPLDAVLRATWRAWNLSLKGAMNRFFGFDPELVYPLAYGEAVLALLRAAGGAFDGTATLTGATTSALSVSGLPAAYRVSVGDGISIPMAGAQRSLHRVLEAVTGSAGGLATVVVEPPVRTGAVIGAATVQLVRPSCIMSVVPGSFQAPIGIADEPVSFDAVQALV